MSAMAQAWGSKAASLGAGRTQIRRQAAAQPSRQRPAGRRRLVPAAGAGAAARSSTPLGWQAVAAVFLASLQLVGLASLCHIVTTVGLPVCCAMRAPQRVSGPPASPPAPRGENGPLSPTSCALLPPLPCPSHLSPLPPRHSARPPWPTPAPSQWSGCRRALRRRRRSSTSRLYRRTWTPPQVCWCGWGGGGGDGGEGAGIAGVGRLHRWGGPRAGHCEDLAQALAHILKKQRNIL